MDSTNIIFGVLVLALGVFFAFFPREMAVLHREFYEFIQNSKGDLAELKEVESRVRGIILMFRILGVALITGTLLRLAAGLT